MRFFSFFFLVAGILTLVGDTTRSVFEGRPLLLALDDFLIDFVPHWLVSFRGWVSGTFTEIVWQGVENSFLILPGSPLFLGLALILFFFGQRRAPRKQVRSRMRR